uniref:Trypanosoma Tc-38 (p38) protein domain-containing protein n=1 Tax=Trypanosoma congolense (strain IL3000) TaxID=1068625 RepID=G0UK48_TRYCI|nr:conserved hypothetical protein [Trypanosoma congolense IL3000]
MGRLRTIFDEPLAQWAENMLRRASSVAGVRKGTSSLGHSSKSEQETFSQWKPAGRVLGWQEMCFSGLPTHHKAPTLPFVLEEALNGVMHAEGARLALAHCPQVRQVTLSNGDTPVLVDIVAPALSMRGVALTHDVVAMEAAVAMSEKRRYTSPFWLSRREIQYFVAKTPFFGSFLRCNFSMISSGATGVDIPSLKLVNDRGEECCVMNLSEFSSTASGLVTVCHGNTDAICGVHHIHSFFLFRQFSPVNVFTRRASFSHEVEDAIRRYCMRFSCWCSVWGTLEDFKAAGIDVLEGPLGLWLFDEWDMPFFLTSALSCVNVKAAFAHVYPNDVIKIG